MFTLRWLIYVHVSSDATSVFKLESIRKKVHFMVSYQTNTPFLPPPHHSEQTQPPEGLHAGGFHSDRNGRLLVRLHPEPLLQGPHEEDDDWPGGPAEGWAEPPRPAAEVRSSRGSFAQHADSFQRAATVSRTCKHSVVQFGAETTWDKPTWAQNGLTSSLLTWTLCFHCVLLASHGVIRHLKLWFRFWLILPAVLSQLFMPCRLQLCITRLMADNLMSFLNENKPGFLDPI